MAHTDTADGFAKFASLESQRNQKPGHDTISPVPNKQWFHEWCRISSMRSMGVFSRGYPFWAVLRGTMSLLLLSFFLGGGLIFRHIHPYDC